MKRTFIGLLILTMASTAQAAPVGLLSEAERADLGKICKHYVNRARFKPRHQTQEFVVTLADGCLSAKRSMAVGKLEERVAAIGFLRRLKVLRSTIIDMNMVRVFGQNYTPFTRISYGAGARTEGVRKVSATGEYLIAHRMGLLAAYQSWLDTGPSLALVSDTAR